MRKLLLEVCAAQRWFVAQHRAALRSATPPYRVRRAAAAEEARVHSAVALRRRDPVNPVSAQRGSIPRKRKASVVQYRWRSAA